MKRPFWMHQFVEYLVGIAMIMIGLQSEEPAGPSLAGGLVLVNAAVADGAMGAWRIVPRKVHRVLDYVLIVGLIALALLASPLFDSQGRIMTFGVSAVLAFVSLNSDYSEKARRSKSSATTPGGRAEDVGRTAGRVTGNAVNMVRAAKRNRDAKRQGS